MGQHSIIQLLAIYVTFSECVPPETTLVQVNLLYRHGDRSPVDIYPKDINQLDAWPDGLGWLSNIGKDQQYKLGQYLRGRYAGFINVTRYNHSEINVEASAVQRCLMSAYSNLAGFFTPQGDQVWNKDLLWQPIPVTSRLEENDNKLALSAKCARYDQLIAKLYESDRVVEYKKKNKAFFQMVSNETGCVESLNKIWEVGDTLICERAHNVTWNDWAYEDGVFDKLMEAKTFGWDLLFAKAELAKLKGGPLLKAIIANMKAASTISPDFFKMHMYSAHDTTVAALTSAMTVFNYRTPPYRTLVMVELHKIDGDYAVKIFFRNDTTKDPYYLVPKGCEDPCKLSTFENVVMARVPEDWNEECKVLNAAPDHLSPASWIALCLAVSLAGTIIAALAIMIKQRRKHSYSKIDH